jgi:hypothetical protein
MRKEDLLRLLNQALLDFALGNHSDVDTTFRLVDETPGFYDFMGQYRERFLELLGVDVNNPFERGGKRYDTYTLLDGEDQIESDWIGVPAEIVQRIPDLPERQRPVLDFFVYYADPMRFDVYLRRHDFEPEEVADAETERLHRRNAIPLPREF